MNKPNDCPKPCESLTEMKGEFKAIKIGATVSAFFIALIFVYIVTYVSQIGKLSDGMIVIQQKLTQLVEKSTKDEKAHGSSQAETRLLRDRICKLEILIEQLGK